MEHNMITPFMIKIIVLAAVYSCLSFSPLYAGQEDDHGALPARAKEIGGHFYPLISMVATQHHVDAALVKAIIMAESSYNPRAISKQGAKGLMQLMPGTAKAFGVEDSFNPLQNILGGVRYFKKLKELFNGNIILALAAYNAGVARVKRHKGIPPFEETRNYINAVLMYYRYYRE
jgi:soluble lytic murein transglycosylase-like protein